MLFRQFVFVSLVERGDQVYPTEVQIRNVISDSAIHRDAIFIVDADFAHLQNLEAGQNPESGEANEKLPE
jgi:hypothetical protein